MDAEESANCKNKDLELQFKSELKLDDEDNEIIDILYKKPFTIKKYLGPRTLSIIKESELQLLRDRITPLHYAEMAQQNATQPTTTGKDQTITHRVQLRPAPLQNIAKAEDTRVSQSSQDSGIVTNNGHAANACGQERKLSVLISSGGEVEKIELDPMTDVSDGSPSTKLPHVGLLRAISMKRQEEKTRLANEALVKILSSLYAKLIVVMGVAFPLSDVISDKIPRLFYEGFYLYLYFVSIIFLIYVYAFLLRETKFTRISSLLRFLLRRWRPMDEQLHNEGENTTRTKKAGETDLHAGSFYLRMGAVAFGIGSMIYSLLEFGMFFELDPKSSCYNVHYAITPLTQMIFTFVQLYFIFMNSKICIYKYKAVARFGLMHMVATNLCVWLDVLVEETKHEIAHFLEEHPDKNHFDIIIDSPFNTTSNASPKDHARHTRAGSVLASKSINKSCRLFDIMGSTVNDASPFLYPCTIEYSLICAAVLYIMWKNIGRTSEDSDDFDGNTFVNQRRHRYSVDCDGAHKGLFLGIFVLVLTIISLILFFVLINRQKYKELAISQAQITEMVLYCIMLLAVIIGFIQMRHLRHIPNQEAELDDILLIVSQIGVYFFAIFSIIGGHHTMGRNTAFVLLTAVCKVCQATLQTMFILDASRRTCYKPEHFRNKPGREVVTFLLVCNFAMWAVNSLETQRTDASPVQLDFFGFWEWTIISNISVPMTIFYRFHCTVCLSEIWKKVYKMKSEKAINNYVIES